MNAAELEATIERESALIEPLAAKAEELSGAIAMDEADLKAATEIRTEEAADFAKEEHELSDVIDTLGGRRHHHREGDGEGWHVDAPAQTR